MEDYSNYTDIFFQNPMLKDIAESAIDDTLEMTVANDTEGVASA